MGKLRINKSNLFRSFVVCSVLATLLVLYNLVNISFSRRKEAFENQIALQPSSAKLLEDHAVNLGFVQPRLSSLDPVNEDVPEAGTYLFRLLCKTFQMHHTVLINLIHRANTRS